MRLGEARAVANAGAAPNTAASGGISAVRVASGRVLWLGAFGSAVAALSLRQEGLAGGAPQVDVAGDGFDALARLRIAPASFDALCLSGLAEDAATELAEAALRLSPRLAVIVHAPQLADDAMVRLVRMGVHDVWRDRMDAAPGVSAEVLVSRLVRSLGVARSRWEQQAAEQATPWRQMLVGESRAMQRVFETIRLVGPRRSTVLITGETGTGKEMVARALHLASDRAHGPLVAVNCSALPEQLLEAELFGHVKGAYTGAFQSRAGRFEQAHQGTIFLDEIAELPFELQAKLLRVLQEREFERLGSSETVKVDVRVVAACNVDLAARVAQGKFREDLYYRINVVPMALPALRERAGDVPLLATHFVEKICRQEQLPVKELTAEALAVLARHEWPGNVRQLENAIEMAVALSGDRMTLTPSDFPLAGVRPLAPATLDSAPRLPEIVVPDDGLDYEATLGRIELSILEQALERTRGNKTLAADLLKLKRTTLAAKLRSLEGQSTHWQ